MSSQLLWRWRRKAAKVDSKIRSQPHLYSERAIGEGQGYVRALREAADALERSRARAKRRAARVP